MKPNLYLFGIIIIFAGSSCNRYYYKPNAVNAPLFTDGGQAHVNLAGSIGGSSKNSEGNTYFFDAQGSVSPVNHLGIIANYSTYAFKASNPDVANGNVNAHAHLLEAGVGGYYAKGKKFKMVADGYVGYGGGIINSDVNMRVRRFFVQPGIGVRSPAFDAAFNLRISNVKYFDFDANGRDNDYLQQKELINSDGRRIDDKSYTFLEPSFTIRAGYKFAKVQLQMVLAQEATPVEWNYNAARFSAGIYFSIEDAIESGKGK
jgi:hypothetical protein